MTSSKRLEQSRNTVDSVGEMVCQIIFQLLAQQENKFQRIMASILTTVSLLESSWLATIAIAVCTLFLAKFWLKIKSYPPGPIPLPLIGNLLSFRTKVHAISVIDTFRKEYGDMFTLWVGAEPVVIVCNWNLTKEALITKSRDFIGRQKRIFSDIQTGGHTNIIHGDGPEWEFLKKIAFTAIRKFVMTEKLRDSVCNIADEIIQNMLNEKQPVNPEEQISYAIYNSMAEIAFGRRYQEHEKEYTEMKTASDLLISEFSVGLPADILPFLRPFYWHKEQRLRSLMLRLRNILSEKYRDHADSYQPGKIRDFADAVIAARKEAEIEENAVCAQLKDENFVNLVADLFLAGTHTTHCAIMWLLLMLGNYEEVQKKMMAEIDEIIGSRMPTQEDKAKCHYISAVIMEAQRFKTIAPFGVDHKASCNAELGGHRIKKGATVVFYQLAQRMNPQNWPEPTEFKPERFLEDDALTKTRKDGYVPFSTGRRVCVGEKLALATIFLTVVRILQKCKITLPNGPGTADFGLTEDIMIFRPKPYQIHLQQRNDLVTT